MAKESKNSGNVYFVDIPKVGAPVSNNTLVVTQKLKQCDSFGNVVSGEKTDMIGSNGQGLYILGKTHPNFDARVAALKLKMERDNRGGTPVLLGPYDTAAEAFVAMNAARDKTPEEAKNIANEQARKLAIENEDLKAKLAEAMKK